MNQSPTTSPLPKRLKNTLIYQGVRILIALINRIPRRLALSLCEALAFVTYLFAPGTRRLTLDNLALAFGSQMTVRERKRLGRQVFQNLGRNAVDAIRLPKITADNVDDLVQAEGIVYLDEAYKMGKGVVAAGCHLGNFELLGCYLALKGYEVTVVTATLYDPRLDTLLRNNRMKGGLHIEKREYATSAVLRALRRGHIVGLLIDQDTRVPGTFVQFFGQPAHTPVGPAILADRTGAPIVPMAIHRLSDDTHQITIRPPIPSSGHSKEAIHKTTQAYTGEIEQFIRHTPVQWPWMHDRWKTKEGSEQ